MNWYVVDNLLLVGMLKVLVARKFVVHAMKGVLRWLDTGASRGQIFERWDHWRHTNFKCW